MLGERLRIVVTASEGRSSHDVGIADAKLNNHIVELRRATENPKLDPLDAARRLHGYLIEPIEAAIAGKQILLLSLDSTLRYVPFAALWDGRAYLIERFRLSVHTVAAQASIASKSQDKWRIAGLGTTRAVAGFPALPGVRDELAGIVGEHNGLPGEIHFDDDFTAERFADAVRQRFPVVHIASHFKFTPGTEEETFLLLGDGRRLSLRDVRQADYTFDGIDLLTLSACETAMLGGRDRDGREIEGLGMLAQIKGAKSVLATLWPIADKSTAILMNTMYRLRERENLDKAEALRRAQLSLLHGNEPGSPRDESAQRGAGRVAATGDKLNAPNPAAPFSHPHYWAPFILMGSWR